MMQSEYSRASAAVDGPFGGCDGPFGRARRRSREPGIARAGRTTGVRPSAHLAGGAGAPGARASGRHAASGAPTLARSHRLGGHAEPGPPGGTDRRQRPMACPPATRQGGRAPSKPRWCRRADEPSIRAMNGPHSRSRTSGRAESRRTPAADGRAATGRSRREPRGRVPGPSSACRTRCRSGRTTGRRARRRPWTRRCRRRCSCAQTSPARTVSSTSTRPAPVRTSATQGSGPRSARPEVGALPGGDRPPRRAVHGQHRRESWSRSTPRAASARAA